MKELGRIHSHCLFSPTQPQSWEDDCFFLLGICGPNGSNKFPWCSVYPILAFIPFDKDLFVLKTAGGLFYIEILVQLLPATSVHCQKELQKVTELVSIAFLLPGSKCDCFVFHGLRMTRCQQLTPRRANQDAA